MPVAFSPNCIGADLSGADLSGADLSGAWLEGIAWDEHTNWENVQGLETAENVPEGLKQLLSLSPPNPPPDAPNS